MTQGHSGDEGWVGVRRQRPDLVVSGSHKMIKVLCMKKTFESAHTKDIVLALNIFNIYFFFNLKYFLLSIYLILTFCSLLICLFAPVTGFGQHPKNIKQFFNVQKFKLLP